MRTVLAAGTALLLVSCADVHTEQDVVQEPVNVSSASIPNTFVRTNGYYREDVGGLVI